MTQKNPVIQDDGTVLVDFLAKVRISANPEMGFPSSRTFDRGDRARLPYKAVQFWLYNGKACVVEPGTPLIDEASGDAPPPSIVPVSTVPLVHSSSLSRSERTQSLKKRFIDMMGVARSLADLMVCTEAIDPEEFSEEDLAEIWKVFYQNRCRITSEEHLSVF